jgi:hypothetical protein
VYSYEHNSKFKVSDSTRDQLLHEIDEDEFYPEPLPNRLMLREVEEFFKSNRVSLDRLASIDNLKKQLRHSCFNSEEVMKDLISYCRISPRLPAPDKNWVQSQPVVIGNTWPREKIVEYLESIRAKDPVADLAFAAFRDMKRSPWKPFMKAALERNPVSIAGCAGIDLRDVAHKLGDFPDESIYDGTRMAQPDEVWNYGRGDGLEKAICLLNIIRSRFPDDKAGLKGDGKRVVVFGKGGEFEYESGKGLDIPVEEDYQIT